MKKIIIILFAVMISLYVAKLCGQDNNDEMKFVDDIAPIAVALHQQNGEILPSITIAQAILESNFGRSKLAVNANNLFGIKGRYQGKSIKMPTMEYQNNKSYTTEAEFRAYPDWKSALKDHRQLLLNGTSWNAHQYDEVLKATNYQEAAYALKKSNYSTDPLYPEKLIAIIEQYHLGKYDQ
ncbi:glycoside hydrolase family 73 protein [Lysinibacillus sphaericus]|uniref:glycoside hydrolase family 73 protein n=1 Tax=Lysinibacillus sphaericus TaxID=1421 RepID=UPI00055B9D0A|nr:glycoside hydrolase family 73 protein [Lysinibacillus sphaericus]